MTRILGISTPGANAQKEPALKEPPFNTAVTVRAGNGQDETPPDLLLPLGLIALGASADPLHKAGSDGTWIHPHSGWLFAPRVTLL